MAGNVRVSNMTPLPPFSFFLHKKPGPHHCWQHGKQQWWTAGDIKVSNMTPLPPLSFFLQVSHHRRWHDRQQWTNDTPTMNGWATSLPSLPFPFSYKNQGYVANSDFVYNSRHDNHERQTMLRWAISFPSLLAFPFFIQKSEATSPTATYQPTTDKWWWRAATNHDRQCPQSQRQCRTMTARWQTTTTNNDEQFSPKHSFFLIR